MTHSKGGRGGVFDVALAPRHARLELAGEVPAGARKKQDVDAGQRVVDRGDEEAVEGEDEAGELGDGSR